MRQGRQRLAIDPELTDHPLAIEQQHGVTPDRLLKIYTLHGHDLRPALPSA